MADVADAAMALATDAPVAVATHAPVAVVTDVGKSAVTIKAVSESVAWEFFEAVRRNDYRAVVEYVEEKGCDPNMTDSFDCTALYLASLLGHVRLIDYFLRRHALPNSRCWDNALNHEARRRFKSVNPNGQPALVVRPRRVRRTLTEEPLPTSRDRFERSWKNSRAWLFSQRLFERAAVGSAAVNKLPDVVEDIVHFGDPAKGIVSLFDAATDKVSVMDVMETRISLGFLRSLQLLLHAFHDLDVNAAVALMRANGNDVDRATAAHVADLAALQEPSFDLCSDADFPALASPAYLPPTAAALAAAVSAEASPSLVSSLVMVTDEGTESDAATDSFSLAGSSMADESWDAVSTNSASASIEMVSSVASVSSASSVAAPASVGFVREAEDMLQASWRTVAGRHAGGRVRAAQLRAPPLHASAGKPKAKQPVEDEDEDAEDLYSIYEMYKGHRSFVGTGNRTRHDGSAKWHVKGDRVRVPQGNAMRI